MGSLTGDFGTGTFAQSRSVITPSATGGSGSGSGNSFDSLRSLFNVGGPLDIPSLGGVPGVLDIASGLNAGLTGLADGLVRASGNRARGRALLAEAQRIGVQGQIAVTESERQGQAVIGAQVAHRGFQGVTMSGSSLDVLEQTARDAIWNTSVIAYNFETHAEAAIYDARLAKFTADQQTLTGIGALAGGVAQGFLGSSLKADAITQANTLTSGTGDA